MINNVFLAAYKPGVQAMADAVHLSLANTARFHAQQLKAVNEALADTALALQEIDAAKDVQTVFEIQARLGRSWLEKTAGSWSALWQAAGQDQMDAFRQAQARVAQLGEQLRETAEHVPAEAAPAVAALRSMVDAACQTYARSAQAAEEISRMAAAHVGTPHVPA